MPTVSAVQYIVESWALFKEAKARGVSRLLLNLPTRVGGIEARNLADLVSAGAHVEHCAIDEDEDLAQLISACGIERTFLGTDPACARISRPVEDMTKAVRRALGAKPSPRISLGQRSRTSRSLPATDFGRRASTCTDFGVLFRLSKFDLKTLAGRRPRRRMGSSPACSPRPPETSWIWRGTPMSMPIAQPNSHRPSHGPCPGRMRELAGWRCAAATAADNMSALYRLEKHCTVGRNEKRKRGGLDVQGDGVLNNELDSNRRVLPSHPK
jgi:hypothetical protein